MLEFHAGRDARNRSIHISVHRAALYSTESKKKHKTGMVHLSKKPLNMEIENLKAHRTE